MSVTKRALENKDDSEPPAKRQKESRSNSNTKEAEKNKDDVKENDNSKSDSNEEMVYTVWLKKFGTDESGKKINEHILTDIYKSIKDANKHAKKLWAKETKEYMEDDPDGMGESYNYDDDDEQEEQDDDIDQTDIDPFWLTTEDFMAYNRNIQVMIQVVEYPLLSSFSSHSVTKEAKQ